MKRIFLILSKNLGIFRFSLGFDNESKSTIKIVIQRFLDCTKEPT